MDPIKDAPHVVWSSGKIWFLVLIPSRSYARGSQKIGNAGVPSFSCGGMHDCKNMPSLYAVPNVVTQAEWYGYRQGLPKNLRAMGPCPSEMGCG